MRWLAALAVLVLVSVSVARGDDTPRPTPFDRGRIGISLGGGTQTNFDTSYVWLGAGVGYFVLDGLEVELDGVHEFGNGPSISMLSPSIRYVAQPLVGSWPVIPYVGASYAHWFFGGGYGDVDTIGARAGVLYISGLRVGAIVLGLGAAYDHVLGSCITGCDSVYPDVTIGVLL